MIHGSVETSRSRCCTLAASLGGVEVWDKAQIVVQSLKTGARKILIDGGSNARYLPTGHIVYAIGGVLFALPFDLRRLEVTGGPIPLVEGVSRANESVTGTAQFSVADSGSLVCIPGPPSLSVGVLLALVDRKGTVEPLKLPAGPYETPVCPRTANKSPSRPTMVGGDHIDGAAGVEDACADAASQCVL